MSSSALSVLRRQLAVVVPPPRAAGSGSAAIPTGLAALDRALTDGGIPCGRLTEVVGTSGSGKTTLVRQFVAGALATRRWVAYVDGTRTLAPHDWAALGDTGRLWVVRPPDADRSAWCADVLLRSGAFGLVVLDGGPPLPRPVAIRLTRLARDRDAAVVVVGEDAAGMTVGSAVRLRVEKARSGGGAGASRRAHRWPGAPGTLSSGIARRGTSGPGPPSHALRIVVDKGGQHHSVEVSCAIDVARRLCAHPEVPDRRGVATRNRRGEKVASPHGGRSPDAGRAEPHGSTLPRKRRCAEPAVRRDAFLLARPGNSC